jgi:hypothetical protein
MAYISIRSLLVCLFLFGVIITTLALSLVLYNFDFAINAYAQQKESFSLVIPGNVVNSKYLSITDHK